MAVSNGYLFARQLAVGLDPGHHVPLLLADPVHQFSRGIPGIKQHLDGHAGGKQPLNLLEHRLRQFQFALVKQLVVLRPFPVPFLDVA